MVSGDRPSVADRWQSCGLTVEHVSKWQESVISLMLSLPRQKVIEAAVIVAWPGAAEIRSVLVNAAATFLLIKKAADGFVCVVLTVAHDAMTEFWLKNGVPSLGYVVVEIKTPGQSLDIAFSDFDPRVGAAIPRALRTFVIWLPGFQNRKFSSSSHVTPCDMAGTRPAGSMITFHRRSQRTASEGKQSRKKWSELSSVSFPVSLMFKVMEPSPQARELHSSVFSSWLIDYLLLRFSVY
jgi:hypothetical protein